jgi:aspartate aminotransferase
LSKRALKIEPSPTLAINAKAKELNDQGVDVISLSAGEPDFNTANNIIEAAYHAMLDGKTKYTAAGGILELKEAIVKKLRNDNDLIYTEQQIIVTNGAKHALYNYFQAVCNPGDEVIIPIPYWVSYPEMVKLADAIPIYIIGNEHEQYKITPDQLEKSLTNNTKVLILNSPSNPTGAIYNRAELTAIAEVCKKHDILIVSDEIYEKLIYDSEEHVSIASLSEDAYQRTLVVNGLSKPYSMTGWRIGYAAGDKKIIKTMADIASHNTSNPVTFAQYGAIEAINGPQDELEKMKTEFAARRDYVMARLADIPAIKPIRPAGAFYVFIDVSDAIKGTYKNADEFSEKLLEEELVAVVPGSAFGADNFIRISYATSREQLEIGLDRIERFIRRLI